MQINWVHRLLHIQLSPNLFRNLVLTCLQALASRNPGKLDWSQLSIPSQCSLEPLLNLFFCQWYHVDSRPEIRALSLTWLHLLLCFLHSCHARVSHTSGVRPSGCHSRTSTRRLPSPRHEPSQGLDLEMPWGCHIHPQCVLPSKFCCLFTV